MLLTSPLAPQIPVFQEGFILLSLPISPPSFYFAFLSDYISKINHTFSTSGVIHTTILPKLIPSICTLVTLEGPFDSVLLPLCLNVSVPVFLNGHSSRPCSQYQLEVCNLHRVTLLQLIMPPFVAVPAPLKVT